MNGETQPGGADVTIVFPLGCNSRREAEVGSPRLAEKTRSCPAAADDDEAEPDGESEAAEWRWSGGWRWREGIPGGESSQVGDAGGDKQGKSAGGDDGQSLFDFQAVSSRLWRWAT